MASSSGGAAGSGTGFDGTHRYNKPMSGETASVPLSGHPEVPLIRADALQRSFAGRPIVRGVSFEGYRGEVLGLVGPNGAGKTTILKMLAGVLAPDGGRVYIDGRDLERGGPSVRQRVGFLPDPPPLAETATISEFLFAGALLYFRARQARQATRALLDRLDLGAVAERRIGQLSHGYRQRVGLARALVGDPEILVLDEPTGGLDPAQTRAFLELVASLKSEAAIVLSSHHLAEVARGCDRVLVLGSGRVLAERSAAAPDLIAARFASPPPAAALAALEGVREVACAGTGRFSLRSGQPELTIDALTAAAAAQGWRLRYLERQPPISAAQLDELIADAGIGT